MVQHNLNQANALQSDYQALEHKFADAMQTQAALRDTYGNTYWYYYQYGNR